MVAYLSSHFVTHFVQPLCRFNFYLDFDVSSFMSSPPPSGPVLSSYSIIPVNTNQNYYAPHTQPPFPQPPMFSQVWFLFFKIAFLRMNLRELCQICQWWCQVWIMLITWITWIIWIIWIIWMTAILLYQTYIVHHQVLILCN